MTNKAGRPKAKVSITFSEEELEGVVTALEFNLGVGVTDLGEMMDQNEVKHLRIIANEMLLYTRLREIRDNKFQTKSETHPVTKMFIEQYSRNVEIESQRRRKQMEGKQ